MKSGFSIYVLGSLLIGFSLTCLNAQDFVLNGSASSLGDDCYQLTPDVGGQAGSIFSEDPIDLTQPFSLNATFFFGCKDGNGADGIVFILALANTSLGNGGGGIGFEGINPSIAVEYDDYFNGNYFDPVSDHMAVISNGVVSHVPPTNLAGPIDLTNIENCMDHCFSVSWNPLTQTLTAVLDEEIITYTGNISNDIFGGITQVYYGFSAGTGSLSNVHRVCFGPPTLSPMPDESLCDGESVVLQADPNGIAWSWAPNPTLSSTSVSNPTATPVVTTTYTTIIEFPCGYVGYDTVVVTVIPPPDVSAMNNGPVCIGETLTLMATGGNSYEWDGPMGYSSTSQNPVINNIITGMAGIYYVTVTDNSGCTAEASTLVVVDPGPLILINPPPTPICENSDPIQLTATPSGGTWSGDITSDGTFDPEYLGAGTHVMTYSATNSNGCTNSSEISLVVLPIPEVIINDPGFICEASNPIQFIGSPPGGIWIGEITLNGLFDPGVAGAGGHLITYIANDGAGCSNSKDISIQVVPDLPAGITPAGPFCVTDPVITFTGTPDGGVWGGIANALGLVYPGNLGAGIYTVIYTYTDQNGCYYLEQDIEIVSPAAVSIDATPPFCLNVPPQTLTATPIGGIWSGAASSLGQIDPAMLGSGNHQVIYTYTIPGGCSDADTTDIIILPDAPQLNNLNLTCDSLATKYVVTFTISGGDPLSYSITGNVPGILIPGNPSIFTSDPITSGDPYSFVIDDMNHCNVDSVSGNFACNCGTNAGTMDLNIIVACEEDTISVPPPSGFVLDPDDTLNFVLHHGFPDSVFLISHLNEFVFGPPLQTGVIYFISSVAGNALPGGGVDMTDPCLSVSFGTPVMWKQNPTGYLTAPSQICNGESASLSFILSGSGPFDVLYEDGSGINSLDSIQSGYSLSVIPSISTIYSLLEISDLSLPGCGSIPDTGVFIEVLPIISAQQTASICAGDSIFLSGAFQTNDGIYFDSITAVTGCDSIIETFLTVTGLDTTFLNSTTCDSSQTGVFHAIHTDEHGCDSTSITTVVYVRSDTTLIQSFTCNMSDAGIFTALHTSQKGCDSLVIENVIFIPADTILLFDETCDTVEAGMFIQIFSNAKGCDSLVIETVKFIPADTTMLSGNTCDVTKAGISRQILINHQGCDSVVIETINLLPSDTILNYTTTCFPQDTGIVVNGYTNMQGCDSLIITITSLAPEDTCIVPAITKDVFIPNIFSPNGDGINDLFMVSSNLQAVSRISFLRLFDRWGGLVLELFDVVPNDPAFGWDGTEKGKPVSQGVFLWMVNIEYTDGKMETRTGDVTVIR